MVEPSVVTLAVAVCVGLVLLNSLIRFIFFARGPHRAAAIVSALLIPIVFAVYYADRVTQAVITVQTADESAEETASTVYIFLRTPIEWIGGDPNFISGWLPLATFAIIYALRLGGWVYARPSSRLGRPTESRSAFRALNDWDSAYWSHLLLVGCSIALVGAAFDLRWYGYLLITGFIGFLFFGGVMKLVAQIAVGVGRGLMHLVRLLGDLWLSLVVAGSRFVKFLSNARKYLESWMDAHIIAKARNLDARLTRREKIRRVGLHGKLVDAAKEAKDQETQHRG